MDMSSGQSVSAETPQFSDGSTVDIHRAAHSDGDIILASNRPKKRAGRKVFKETRHPVYRGIRRRNKDKWVCELREPNKKSRIWLGTFPTAEMAARAHDVAALALRGTSACLNFADSYWRLPKPASNDAEEIRRVAAEAAKEFRHGHNEDESVQLLQQEIEKSYKHGGVASNNVEHAVDESTFYMDEEAIFDMPGLLSNMAEGLLMSPPKCTLDSEMMTHDDYDDFGHLPLWSFSI